MRPKTSHETTAQVQKTWYLLDAENKVLGRMARDIAVVLMGKHAPSYSPHLDNGHGVVVVNVDKLAITGNKAQDKTYARVTGYPGGRRVERFSDLMQRHPDRVLRKAVQRMLPKTPQGKILLGKLRMFTGPEHPHAAQQPASFPIGR
ncbi:MAG TPA: 50S ribosomal protein L13 [Planctomycetota bacterium]